MGIKYFIREFFLTFAILSLLMANSALCQDLAFTLEVDHKVVEVGDTTTLRLKINGARNVTIPRLPKIEGFAHVHVGQTINSRIVNASTTILMTHSYALTALKKGKFTIGPFAVEHNGKQYASNSVTVEVGADRHSEKGADRHSNGTAQSNASPGSSGRTVSRGGRVTGQGLNGSELTDRIFLTVTPRKSTAYINEFVPVTIKLFIKNLNIRDIDYPQFSLDWLSVGEYDKPIQRRENINGSLYNTIEFKTRFFATKTGTFDLGSVVVKCELVVESRRSGFPGFDDQFFSSFFNTYSTKPIEVVSNTVPFKVLPLPDKDRPDEFRGAVGNFNFQMDAYPKELDVGDPVTVTMTISGRGNFNTVKTPVFDSIDQFKVYEPEVKSERGIKTFKQAIIPKNSSVKQLPKTTFSFFNPETGRYQSIVRWPIDIKVSGAKDDVKAEIVDMTEGGEKQGTDEKEVLGKDLLYIKETKGEIVKKEHYRYRDFIFLIILITVIYITLLYFMQQRRKLRVDVKYARRLKAPKRARENLKEAHGFLMQKSTGEFYSAIFKTLQEYLVDKLHLPPGNITFDAVAGALGNSADEGQIKNLGEILNACDVARFAQTGGERETMDRVYSLTEEFIDYVERVF